MSRTHRACVSPKAAQISRSTSARFSGCSLRRASSRSRAACFRWPDSSDMRASLRETPAGDEQIETRVTRDVLGLRDVALGVAYAVSGVDDLDVRRRAGAVGERRELVGL